MLGIILIRATILNFSCVYKNNYFVIVFITGIETQMHRELHESWFNRVLFPSKIGKRLMNLPYRKTFYNRLRYILTKTTF